jgi:hypothetical protein
MENKFVARTKWDLGKLYLECSYNRVHWSSIGIQNPETDIPAIIKVLAEALIEITAADEGIPNIAMAREMLEKAEKGEL